jgi:hypothetical protein
MSDLFGLTQAGRMAGDIRAPVALKAALGRREQCRDTRSGAPWCEPADPPGRPSRGRASMQPPASIESQLEMTRIAKNTTDMHGPPGLQLVVNENKAGGGLLQFNGCMRKS